MSRRALLIAAGLACLAGASPCWAHELRPGYLELRETDAGRYDVLWKVPARGNQRLALEAELPGNCATVAPRTRTWPQGAVVERWRVACADGLAGKSIRIGGLDKTLTDVLVRLQRLDSATEVRRLTPDEPSFVVPIAPDRLDVVRTYFALGVEHILLGVDHLLFVLALLLLVRDGWMLVKTITAFTVAHSITLALATLGHAAVPQRPVEAVIALSIVFLAAELAREADPERLSRRFPWVVAFVFGLLHGFGFAGALKEAGLPETDIPLALLMFNLGVEAGQLLFVGAVLVLVAAARRLFAGNHVAWSRAPRITAYAIGCVAAYWLIDRLAGLA